MINDIPKSSGIFLITLFMLCGIVDLGFDMLNIKLVYIAVCIHPGRAWYPNDMGHAWQVVVSNTFAYVLLYPRDPDN